MVKQYNYLKLERNLYTLDKPIIIYCMSTAGLNMYRMLKLEGINVIGFSDSNVENKSKLFCGLPVFSVEDLKKMDTVTIVIATQILKYKREILDKLSTLNNAVVLAWGDVYGPGEYDTFHMEKVIETDKDIITRVSSKLQDNMSRITFDNLIKYRLTNDTNLIEEIYEKSHPQYFPDKSIIKLSEDEIFVDAGAYDGMTSLEFINQVNDKYRKIYLMEPDELMWTIAKEMITLKEIKNAEVVKAGAFSSDGIIGFNINSSRGSSFISDNGSCEIKTISIDSMLAGQEATYIKMDIEGVELEAIKGARKTIDKYMPKLAISIYHKEDDLWKIPWYILNNWPDYKIWMRHYTDITTETILYATL